MEISNLFGHSQSQSSGDEAPTQFKVKNVSIVSYLNTKPLVYGLEKGLVNHDFNLQKDVPSVCAQRLLQGEVEMGLVPSVEYAHSKGAWKIVPDLCIASKKAVKSVALFFNRDIRTINRIALDTSSRTSVALLKILLREKYEIEPEFVVMPPNMEEMLKRADAALIIGDKALHYQAVSPAHIDLGEEWYDLTGLPFVYAFWAGHELSITRNETEAMKKSYEIGAQNIEKISKEYSVGQPQDWEFYYDYLTQNIYYKLGDEEKEGLKEFYHYAFYLGLIDHIPELHFYED
ncbi:MAG: menaquinone biosynthesis protein [Calditrichaeota bacterium]|nr:menaquinone biosynthesis protein [Calditrichota bacterium]